MFLLVLLLLLVWLLLLAWLLLRNLWCHWFRAQLGNWHACSVVLMCCNSWSSLSCEEDTTFALWANVL